MKAHINYKLSITGIATFIILLFICETVEAQTPAGAVHHSKASRRRTAVVVSSATKANDQQQAAAEAPPPAEAAPAPATTEPAPAQTTPPPASTEALLPLGTVVTKLPAGCVTVASGGQQYYQCGANYYAAAYQEGTLMYVTVAPPK